MNRGCTLLQLRWEMGKYAKTSMVGTYRSAGLVDLVARVCVRPRAFELRDDGRRKQEGRRDAKENLGSHC